MKQHEERRETGGAAAKVVVLVLVLAVLATAYFLRKTDDAPSLASADVIFWRTRALEATGRLYESIESLDLALEADPQHLPSLLARARWQSSIGGDDPQLRQALENQLSLGEGSPGKTAVFLALSRIEPDAQRARGYAEQAAGQPVDTTDGHVLASFGALDPAIATTHLNAALQIDANHRDARLARAWQFAAIGRLSRHAR